MIHLLKPLRRPRLGRVTQEASSIIRVKKKRLNIPHAATAAVSGGP